MKCYLYIMLIMDQADIQKIIIIELGIFHGINCLQIELKSWNNNIDILI
jgi:hypothetical protein